MTARSDADGWLTTGDVGYLTEDARLVLTGREKDLIVRSGHNIDPAAIEDVANRFAGVQISAAVGMPDQYAGEVPALFVVPRAGRAGRSRGAEGAPRRQRPRAAGAAAAASWSSTRLPVTAVGKIFKPALRDLAIKEKVRLEVGAHLRRRRIGCGRGVGWTTASTRWSRSAVAAPTPAQLAELEAALKPLPQTYVVRGRDAQPAEAVTLAFEDGIATLTLNRPDSMNALSRGDDAVAGAPASRPWQACRACAS